MRLLRRSCASDSALSFQAVFTLAIDVALVGIDVAAGVARINHRFKVQGIVLAGGADLDLANELVALVGISRELIAEVGLAVLPGPAGVDVLLAPLRGLPVGRHRVLSYDGLFVLVDRLPGRLRDARVNHLATTRHIAVDRQLAIDRVKNALAGASLNQAFFEGPDRGPVGNLAAVAQSDKTLETEAVEQLELHLLVA